MTLKKKLALAVLLLLVAPLALFNLVNLIKGYLPPSDPRLKAPFQFEEAFNERMAVYGMSLDLDSANYGYGNGHVVKTVPVQCADGSDITCTFYATSDRKKALITRIQFAQALQNPERETVYLEPLTRLLLGYFEAGALEHPDEGDFGDESSYNTVMRACRDFPAGEAAEYSARIRSTQQAVDGVVYRDGVLFTKGQQGGKTTLTVLLRIHGKGII